MSGFIGGGAGQAVGTSDAPSFAGLTLTGRFKWGKGASVASANDMTLGTDGNVFSITGTTQINTISASSWPAGSLVVLLFDTAITVKHMTAGAGAQMRLQGAADFSATADDVLALIYDGTVWRQAYRTVL